MRFPQPNPRVRVGLPTITIHRRFSSMPLAADQPWHLAAVGAPAAHDAGHRGNGVVVGVVDSGVDARHVQSTGLLAQVIAAKDFTSSRSAQWDKLGHGTHVSGLVAQVAPRAKLLSAKALGDGGEGSDRAIAEAIAWCVSQGSHVINLSLGSPSESPSISAAISAAISAGVTVVCASGNEGDRHVSWPASDNRTISVGALDRDQRPAAFSSPSSVDCAAPGVRVRSLYLDGGFAELSGTSMAAPIVTGLLALFIGRDLANGVQLLPHVAMLARCRAASIDVGPTGPDRKTGAGLLSAEKWLEAVKPEPTDPPPTGKEQLELLVGGRRFRWSAELVA